MQIFELHFNPKIKENQVFDTYIYEPESSFEKKLGGIYMAGEIKNALSKKSLDFLDNLSKTIRKNYYSLSAKTQEKALSSALKSANEFLSEEIKRENVNWLGNLNFAALSLKDSNLAFTLSGDIRLIMIREGGVIDIGKNLNLEGIDPYPLKVFLNVASGRIAENDVLLVLTKDIFVFLKNHGILKVLAETQDLDEKKIKQILPRQLFSKGEGSKISGLSMFFVFKGNQKKPFSMFFKKEAPKPPSIPSFSILAKPINIIKKAIGKPRLPKIKNPFVSLKNSSNPAIESLYTKNNKKNKLLIILILFVVLIAGFFLFKNTDTKKEKDVKSAFEKIEVKARQAEAFLALKEDERANNLFKEVLKEITPLCNQKISFNSSIVSLKETIEKNLEKLNYVEEISSPELLTELSAEEIGFNPTNIVFSLGNVYLYKESSNSIYTIKDNEKFASQISKDLQKMDNSSGTILGFSYPESIFYLEEETWKETEVANPPASGLFSSYLSHLYFLDPKNCNIVKYSHSGNFEWTGSKEWSKGAEQACLQPKSMAIDGSIWVLNGDNSITRYYTGKFQENIILDIYPFIKNVQKIEVKASSPYLFLLEGNRIIVSDKTGKLVKQFKSQAFNDLKDFSVSEDAKTLYLLNGLQIFTISI